MPLEYLSLTVLSFLFLIAWLPSSFGKLKTFGLGWLLSNRTPVEGKSLKGWADRCERAHNNLKDNFPSFAVAILILGSTNQFDQTTAVTSVLYVLARLGHFISYGFGKVTARATFFFIGLICNCFLFFKIIW